MKQTQQKKILAYCNLNHSITIREAFEKLKINSPSKRISEMRHSPLYDVNSIVEYSNEGVPYKRYYIKEVRVGG